jgi:hypothetical protein
MTKYLNAAATMAVLAFAVPTAADAARVKECGNWDPMSGFTYQRSMVPAPTTSPLA